MMTFDNNYQNSFCFCFLFLIFQSSRGLKNISPKLHKKTLRINIFLYFFDFVSTMLGKRFQNKFKVKQNKVRLKFFCIE